MRYELFGRSGLDVSEMALGTMTFGQDWGWGASMEESRRIFEAYVEAGGNFIDTAVNYTDGSSERDLLPMARHEDLAVTTWGVLSGGVLTGKYRDPKATTRYEGASESDLTVGDGVVAMANELGRPAAQVAINWVRQRPWGGAPILPIIGARKASQLEDNLAALDWSLTEEQIASLDALSPIRPGFPHGFLATDMVRGLIHGETYDRIDDHRKTD